MNNKTAGFATYADALNFVKPLVAPYAAHCVWASDYDCRCSRCSALTRAMWYVSAFVWSVATGPVRAEVESALGGFKALALVGAAVEAALSPGKALTSMMEYFADAWTSDGGNLKGFYFKVVGKRGNAKKFAGKVGICKWVGETTFGGYYDRRAGHVGGTTTTRIGLQVEGEEKLVYVPFKQCERLPIPAEVTAARTEAKIVKEAIATLRPKWNGTVPKKGRTTVAKWKASCPVAYVVTGKNAGKSGKVFWVGADKKTGEAGARLGMETETGETLWLSAYECADRPVTVSSDKALIERIAADAALEGNENKARELLAQTWEEV
jgi:hypothetical protein